MKKWTSILIIAIIVIGLSTGGVLTAREFYFREDDEEVRRAQVGDTVEIHYVGRLRNPDVYDGLRIFDTSYDTIPGVESPRFTLTYDERERGEPFEFTLGEGVIEGWNENVKGMREGESKRFSVPPEKGYGHASEDLIYQIPKTETVPVYQRMPAEEFREKFGEPSINMVVEDQFWGWEKTVISVGADVVRLRHEPDVGDRYNSYSEEGLITEVKDIDSSADGGRGEISLENTVTKPTVVNSEHLSQHDERFREIPQIKGREGQSQDGQGIVIPNENDITVDFNDEVVGRTLFFEVEVLSIEEDVETEE